MEFGSSPREAGLQKNLHKLSRSEVFSKEKTVTVEQKPAKSVAKEAVDKFTQMHRGELLEISRENSQQQEGGVGGAETGGGGGGGLRGWAFVCKHRAEIATLARQTLLESKEMERAKRALLVCISPHARTHACTHTCIPPRTLVHHTRTRTAHPAQTRTRTRL